MINSKFIQHIIHIMLQGLFWLLPIIGISVITTWLYHKIELLIGWVFELIGFIPESHILFWNLMALGIALASLYLLGWFVRTRYADLFDYLFCKIPGYGTIKGLVGIFNSSKEGKNRVLVVAIKGFTQEGYNIGLMYSQKESIIQGHYTVTLSMSPIPNGGFMFEVPKENIFVIEHATFDSNLQYLLSMGVRSLTEILKTQPKSIEKMMPLEEWLERYPLSHENLKLSE